jgi:hypothetical protein
VADEADLVLKTTIGNIEVTGVSGQLSLTSDGGSINLSQVTLTRNSSVKTHTGTITFDGAIDPDGSYQFESDTGVINVRLPDNASYHLDVTTNGGSFNSDPPIPTPDANQASNGFQIDVGKPPRAILILKTDIGSINLSNQRQ